MWGNDYPHPESTFPDSRILVADEFSGWNLILPHRSSAETPPESSASTTML